MAVRGTMASLITRLRLTINDTAGASQQFTDQQLQDWLDLNRIEVRYHVLRAVPSIAAGGITTYKVFFADCGNWEDSPSVVTGSYAAATPTTLDYLTGRFEYATDQSNGMPLLISGYVYDLYGAAVMALEAWLAASATSVDFSEDGVSVKESQQSDQLRALLESYRTRAGQWSGVAAAQLGDGGTGAGRWLNTDINLLGGY